MAKAGKMIDLKKRLAQEQGTIRKDWGGRIPVALVYPNTYYVGMSSLGFQTIYKLFNDQLDIVCERAFLPDTDYRIEWPGNRRDPASGIFGLESGRPLRDYAVVAFSVSYELDYFHMLQILRMAGIPIFARDRDETHPLVIAGGACMIDNPEPAAPFLDVAVVGEGEVTVPPLIAEMREHGFHDRERLLRGISRHPGLYVPAFYDAEYHPNGVFKGIAPNERHPIQSAESKVLSAEYQASSVHSALSTQHSALPIVKQRVRNLNDFETTSVVLTQDTEFGSSYLIEVARGCARGCRFCLASYGFMPQRERTLESVVEQARRGLRFRDKIGLMGASVSDYHAIDELVTEIKAMGGKMSLASMRADSISPAILSALIETGTRTITFAPEGGSQRMREVINKNLTEDQILECVELVGRHGGQAIKLYFMIGLPGEEMEDVEAIAELALKCKARLDRYVPGAEVQGSVTPHVPKSHTPFQWAEQFPLHVIEERSRYLAKTLRQKGVVFKIDSPRWLRVQGVLSRGDRRLAEAIARVEDVNYNQWTRALAAAGLTEDFYTRARPVDEVFPWSHIEEGVSNRALQTQWERANSQRPGYDKPIPRSGVRPMIALKPGS